MDMMTMTMYFYQSEKVHFLFKSYDVHTDTGYFGVCVVAFFIGFVTELLSVLQDRIDQQVSSKIREEQRKQRNKRFSQGLVFLFRVFMSYICMLAVMTFNVGIMLCVASGLAVAYFILGFQPAEVIVVQNTLYGETLNKNKGQRQN